MRGKKSEPEEIATMHDRATLLERTLGGRVVAIVRLAEPASLVDVAAALIAGGIYTLEFTLTTPGALEAISACRARFSDDAVIGAGTVLDANEARQCLAAGAQFLVSPGTDPAVIDAARDGGALSMPGALTPTEIIAAWRAGADVVKVFPARQLGPQYIRDLRGPLPQIPLMPTGGVDERNAADYLRAGAVGVAVGGNLIDPAAVARGDWAAITVKARALAEAVGASIV
jgi:2-dehydro-3-deoxyphosphogluconate aldolase/(4S)-4-hydroxy-2-oxoglutarate aldolase